MIARLQRYALAALGVIGTVLGALLLGRRQGASEARKTDKLEDYKNADEIQSRADDARADSGDSVEWLQSRGKIRDD